jgi:hypothetical protein
MKSIFTLAVLVVAAACTTASAATLSVTQSADKLTNSLYINGGATNGTFNTVILSATPDGSATFVNQNSGLASGVPRAAGAAFTYRNRALDLDPADPDNPGIGKGWSVLGITSTATAFTFTGGPIGANISTAAEPNGNLHVFGSAALQGCPEAL